ncbi:hypothetical protein [Nocardia noduli]|uniref:hypothetical protein n=1 Tax=Nocardia noduli TaxID=2815722 RepID=UPI001C243DB9|nr:hypothetical protein [Nocardia noduli]
MRTDLLALTDDSLTALTNRGMVKRASRDLERGEGPTLAVTDDGTVTGRFEDGTTTTLPTDVSLETSSCTCHSVTLCRHRLMTVMTYRADAAAEPVTPWSPAEFDDDQLVAHLGPRATRAARKALRLGYRATVIRPSTQDPVPTVELPTVTVRFLVPHDLGYARTDAAVGANPEAVALAVWAFRLADRQDPDLATVHVDVGGTPTTADSGTAAALIPLTELISHGVVHTSPQSLAAFAVARKQLESSNARWPLEALDALTDQLRAYRDLSARYDPVLAAALVAEIVARHRGAQGGRSIAAEVLGSTEAARTPMRLLRLTGLGARVTGDTDSRTVEVYLAQPDTGMVLAIHRRIELNDTQNSPTAAQLGSRMSGPARLSAIASGYVVTHSASRAANRQLHLGRSTVARTTITPSAGAWETLPQELLVADLDAEADRLADRRPAVIRPRLRADSIRVIAVESVEGIEYFPATQELRAHVRAAGGSATIVIRHSTTTPGALDCVASALASGEVRYIAGELRRRQRRLHLRPTALVLREAVIVPDFAPVEDSHWRAATIEPERNPLGDSVAAALELSSEVPHRGSRHLPPSWFIRAADIASDLRHHGLARAAEALLALRSPHVTTLDTWADSHLRLLLTAEQL